ncbi:zinc ribbon domain-containing protein [Candidatus Zixiibacteriota bacterium]
MRTVSPTYVLRESKGHFNGSVTNRGPAKYLFSGLLECGKCGGSMIVTNSGSYSAYICNNCLNRGKSICDNNRRILRTTVERDLLGGIQKLVLAPKILERLVKRVNVKIAGHLKAQPSRNRVLKERIAQLEKEIDNLSKAVLEGNNSDTVAKMLIKWETELAKCKKEMEACPKQVAKATPAIDMAWVSSKIDDLRDLFSRHQNKMELVREELRALLGGKVKLIPLPDGGKWAYQAEATLKPGNVLAGHPFQYSVIALQCINRGLEVEKTFKVRPKAA